MNKYTYNIPYKKIITLTLLRIFQSSAFYQQCADIDLMHAVRGIL